MLCFHCKVFDTVYLDTLLHNKYKIMCSLESEMSICFNFDNSLKFLEYMFLLEVSFFFFDNKIFDLHQFQMVLMFFLGCRCHGI